MKKSLSVFVLTMCIAFYSSAQLENRHWEEVEYHFNSDYPNAETKVLLHYWIEGDTVFHGISYKKLYRKCLYQDSVENKTFYPVYGYADHFLLGIREDEQNRVFVSFSDLIPKETLLYDFSEWNTGDSLFIYRPSGSVSREAISDNSLDSILLLNGRYAKTFSGFDQLVLIRGIGFDKGFLFTLGSYKGSYMGGMMVRFYQGNQLIWNNPNYVGIKRQTRENLVRSFSENGFLNFNLPNQFATLEIFSAGGKRIRIFNYQAGTRINVGPLLKGVYIYRVTGNDGSCLSCGKAVVL